MATSSSKGRLSEPWNEGTSSLDVAVSVEESLLFSQFVIQVVELWSALAWYCILREGAGHGQLVEHGLVAADEAVLLHLGAAVELWDDVADVEYEAVVGDVGVVTIPGRAGE